MNNKFLVHFLYTGVENVGEKKTVGGEENS